MTRQIATFAVAELFLVSFAWPETRGAVPFHPGMSPHQARALAGGTCRGASEPVRKAITSVALLAAEEELGWLLAERERLQAKLVTLRRDAAGTSEASLADQLHEKGATPLSRLQQADRAVRMVRTQSSDQLRFWKQGRGHHKTGPGRASYSPAAASPRTSVPKPRCCRASQWRLP